MLLIVHREACHKSRDFTVISTEQSLTVISTEAMRIIAKWRNLLKNRFIDSPWLCLWLARNDIYNVFYKALLSYNLVKLLLKEAIMNRRDFLKSCAAAAKGFALSNCAVAAAGCDFVARPSRPWVNHGQDARATHPNIVFIYIDDMGWRDVGFMGSRYYETPNIDRLARQSMVFTNAYANAPNCAP